MVVPMCSSAVDGHGNELGRFSFNLKGQHLLVSKVS